MRTKIILSLLIISGLCFAEANAQQTLSGTVADESGMPLANANIVVEGTKDGVVTDFDGNFTLTTDREFPIKLLISYVGFETQTLTVENAGAIQVSLKEGNIFDEVIVSASRRAEKLQEAPSAVSVLNAEELSNSGGKYFTYQGLDQFARGGTATTNGTKNQFGAEGKQWCICYRCFPYAGLPLADQSRAGVL